MTTKQQQEALDYFRTHAEDWRSKADGLKGAKVNVIEQRNDYILQVEEERSTTRAFLDIGCGTGELVCQAARRGIDSTGVDYAPEMVELAQSRAQEKGITRAKFVCRSIFDFDMKPGQYDLISANGLIEYISLQEMTDLFGIVADALTPGGSFVVGSRNRLFNFVSMNDYTVQEVAASGFDLLLQEAVKWTMAHEMLPVVKSECAPLQPPDTQHAKTGIDVATRFQYSPFQLMNLLQDKGLRAVEVYPVHIHGVTPAFSKMHADVHVFIANLLQAQARQNTQLLAHASTFMLHVQKD